MTVVSDFEVVCVDGPAAGWRYMTCVEPDRTIWLTRVPGPFGWVRVLEGWAGAIAYTRTPGDVGEALERSGGALTYVRDRGRDPRLESQP